MSKTLDLGCGPHPNNPFNADEVYGVDVRSGLGDNILSADLAIEQIPFEDSIFDFVTAYNFIEHIPRIIYAPTRRNSFIELMNEIYRVLKINGVFLSLTPAYPHNEAFQDPTHVNIITEETFIKYFDDTYRWGSMYGFIGSFRILKQEWLGGNLVTQMQKN
jgi:SAM-dependent methyltransferase